MEYVKTKDVRELEISGPAGKTKFFWDRDGYPKISRFPKELEFEKGLGISSNNSLKPTPSTVSKGRKSRII